MTMNNDTCVITLSKQERMNIEMIVIDSEKDAAHALVRGLQSRTETTVKGMKFHLDR